MLKFLKEKTTTAIIIVFVFALLTRTTDIVAALLIYLVVANFPVYSSSKKVMRTLSIINLVMAGIFGLYSLVSIVLRITGIFDYENIIQLSVISAIIALLATLLHLTILIVYLIIEMKGTVNKLFAIAMVLPIFGIIYQVADDIIVSALYNFFLSFQPSGSSYGTLSTSPVGIFGITQIILLVYILLRPQEELEIME